MNSRSGLTESVIVPVLAGGGARLSAHIGVLDAIRELNLGYDTLVGVSGGSIVGALHAAGKSCDELLRIAENTDFSQFSSQNLVSLLRTGGFSNGDHFERWIDEQLEGRTFSDLQLDYHVVATDVRTGQPHIFSRETHPDTPVAAAVRCSMSIPILFSFKEFDNRLLVDGSILSEEALQRNWAGDGTPVIVFKLRSSQGARERPRARFLPLRGHLEMLVNTFMVALSREFISEDIWLSTLVIDTGEISPIELSLSGGEKRRLYEMGRGTTLLILPRKLAQGAQRRR